MCDTSGIARSGVGVSGVTILGAEVKEHQQVLQQSDSQSKGSRTVTGSVLVHMAIYSHGVESKLVIQNMFQSHITS